MLKRIDDSTYECDIPMRRFSIVVAWDAEKQRWVATDNGHAEITLLTKFEKWAETPFNYLDILAAVGVVLTKERELVCIAKRETDTPEEVARPLVAAICYLDALRNPIDPYGTALKTGHSTQDASSMFRIVGRIE